ncbi:MAG: hypothetical protein D3924_03960 [Candidatus Electrothrix sp. AR4]|nr:hypothetical protein [Candidatus Electrothrix sp. AR4]
MTLQPLKAVIHADVMDIDGRTVSAKAGLPVRHLAEYLGVQSDDCKIGFAVRLNLLIGKIRLYAKVLGQMAHRRIKYRLVREEVDYQWFQKNGKWGYERIIRDQEELRDQLVWEQVEPMQLSLAVGQGRYRLELFARDNATLLTSFRFVAGEQLVGKSDTPDAVKVTLDRQEYQAGDIAQLTVTSPYPGQASLVLANSSIHGVRNFPLTEVDSQEHTLEIPVTSDWGAGVYALVTVYRPGHEQKKGADRAVGLVWLNVDPEEQRLEVAINSPDQIRPRQTLQVPVAVKGAERGQTVRLTLAAVDDGVLQLTGFVAPDPLAWFFDKQQLGVEIRDLYGQLIIPPDSKPLNFRTGAGEQGLRGAPESNVRVVSIFSGAVQAGEDGIALVPLEIPDFNGRLRLMAVAWSKEKLGSASRDLQINDPVVVSVALPRYLAQGDQSNIQLLLENIDGPAGEYQIAWKAEGAVAMEPETTEASENTASAAAIRLAPGKRQNINFPVYADNIGKGSLRVDVSGPDGYSYTGDFPLNVRGKYLPSLSRSYAKLDPGAVVTLDKETISGLFPATAEVALSISSAPNLDVAGVLAQLDRYPHGCLEQLTSRAMPLLYANLLAEGFAYPLDKELPGRVQEAVDRILQKQLGEGSFSLWTENGDAQPWLSAYAMDFLQRAREKGYAVPDYFYKKGVQWLTDLVKRTHDPEEKQLAALAYAHWVLVRAGQGRHEDARYLFDTWFSKISSPLAKAQLAGALSLLGDQGRAVKGLRAALLPSSDTFLSSWRSYGSRLRDLAGIIHIIAESGTHQADPAPAWEELTRLLGKKRYLSTQEQAWLIMAALTLEQSGPLDVEITEVEKKEEKTPEKNTTFFSLQRDGASLLSNPVTIRNKGTAPVWIVTVVQGAPIDEPEPLEHGFTIWREWYSTSGSAGSGLKFSSPAG